jgi:hypothetical protein
LSNSIGLPSLLDYNEFVTIGQTHSHQTHQRYYVKQSLDKKRKYDEGTNLQNIFQTFLHGHPLPAPSIETSRKQDNVSVPPPVAVASIPFNTTTNGESCASIASAIPFDTTTNGPIGGNISIDEIYDFGGARTDVNKKGKRFEWSEKEIGHLQHYILNIEPSLPDSEKKNKYSTCLNYLKRADASIQQDFHPFHCESSSRLKTGYEVALKRIG